VAEYVYGILEPAATAPAASGIAGAPLRVVGGDGAAALVSDVPAGELRFGREELLTHSRVLEAAIADGTVLPMRFGVVMEPTEVRKRLLESHGEALRAQLHELAGKVEMSVRVLYEEQPLMRGLVAQHREIAELRDRVALQAPDATYYERIRLGELVAEALERRREADAAELLEELSAVSLAVNVGASTHERVALSASFLVRRDGQDAFDETLERQAAARRDLMRFKCVGPLPPHSFVDLAAAV